MKIQALGLIEIRGFLGAVAAADAALKTANVTLINAEKIRGGLTTIHLDGDVAAVQVAVEAGSAVARELGTLLSYHVIPRLSEDTAKMVTSSIKKTANKKVVKKEAPTLVKEEIVIDTPVKVKEPAKEEKKETLLLKEEASKKTEKITEQPKSKIEEIKLEKKSEKHAPKIEEVISEKKETLPKKTHAKKASKKSEKDTKKE